jgi:ribosomal protein S18 acetylase RimI-like enzyme
MDSVNVKAGLQTVSIERLSETNALRTCAKMMVRSNPWNVLHFTEDQCFKDLTNPLLDIFGAMNEQRDVLGFLAAMSNGIGFEPMIEYLCVHEDFRGCGVGTKLISHFETILFPAADNLYLFVSDINPKAIELYIRLGYLPIGALPNFNLVGQTEFLHRKSRRPKQQARGQVADS